MQRRGDQLTEHILYAAKNVFLEMGFERASMDVIAARAETSKRTLYAHFESKEKLYIAVIDLVRGSFLERLKTPKEYPGDPFEVLVQFCGRLLEILLFAPVVLMCRLCIAEVARFPQGSAQYFDVIFTETQGRLDTYLRETFGLTAEASAEAAQNLLARVIHPRFPRALFGVDPLTEAMPTDTIRADLDLEPIRHAVAELIGSLPGGRTP